MEKNDDENEYAHKMQMIFFVCHSNKRHKQNALEGEETLVYIYVQKRKNGQKTKKIILNIA